MAFRSCNTRGGRLLAGLGFVLLLACLTPSPLRAYVDPGTSQAVFGSLGWMLAGLAAGIGILIRPLRALWRKIRKRPPTTDKDHAEPT